jgi:Flp pilus assembly protein TadG
VHSWRRLGGRARRDERGAEAVEFALIVPVLVLLLLGIIFFGLLFGSSIELGDGVSAGARAAALNDYTYSGTCTGSGVSSQTADMVCNIAQDVGGLAGTATPSIGICFATAGSATPCGAAGDSVTDDVVVCARGYASMPFISTGIGSTSRQLIEEPQPSGTAVSYGAFASGSSVTWNSTTIEGTDC